MDEATIPPHVLIFPFPLQGHVNSMLKLAELLGLAGVHISFVVSANTHDHLLRYANIQSRFSCFSGFFFETLPDDLYEGSHSSDGLMKLHDSLNAVAKPFLRELLVSDRLARRPVTCIIADGILSLAYDVAREAGIPLLYFRTISACAFWSYFSIPELIEAGELPFNGDDIDLPIANIRGMESFLRRRDLPSFCRVCDLASHAFQMILTETRQTTRAQGFILNTFEGLEAPILDHIRTQCPNVYTIGPLHAHLKAKLAAAAAAAENILPSTSSNSLRKEDKSCLSWLDEQPTKSVLYVSFGSLAITTKHEVMEFWHGLRNSGKRFLWVIRQDSVSGKDGEDKIPADIFESSTKDRGYFVDWAPQEEVLAHPAVGGFLTHSGWNSTLESIVEGVPMICWPYFADQQVNSRFVGEVWKLGLDMKDTCDRVIIEKMVKDLMDVRRDEFMHNVDQMASLARESVSESGSSHFNLDRLIHDIRLMGTQTGLQI